MDLTIDGCTHGVVCAPEAKAVESGRAVLAEGGNAIEAMLAMAASIAVTYPHMNSIGGDAFWLIHLPGGKVVAIDACGAAGARASIETCRKAGFDRIPVRGAPAACTVAGAVAGWLLAHELSRAQGGCLPLSRLLADARRLAAEGCAVSASEARYPLREEEMLRAAPGFLAHFWPDDQRPPAGTLRRQPRLADTLEHLSRAGLADFYRGDIAREIAADLENIGAPVTRADLAACTARPMEPLALRIRRGMLYNTAPPTQGLASLLLLGLLERLGPLEPESFAFAHAQIEATKAAYRVRDRIITDPAHLREDPRAALTEEALASLAAGIDARRASQPRSGRPAEGDTVWMGAADASGLAVSYIQSIFWEYGSGCVLPATGILWQNRGIAFSLHPDSLNPLQPGRKPFHTLNPALVVLDDGRVMPYGSMGGEGQPQFQSLLFARHVWQGQPLDLALDAPRWLYGRKYKATESTLRLESRIDSRLAEQLEAAGHPVVMESAPYLDAMGHAGLVAIRPDGSLYGGHDPRADGGAAGI